MPLCRASLRICVLAIVLALAAGCAAHHAVVPGPAERGSASMRQSLDVYRRAAADSARADSLRTAAREEAQEARARADSLRVLPPAAGPAGTAAADTTRKTRLAPAPRQLGREVESAEPWIIEGESLQGTRTGGTNIQAPRITHGVLVITADEGQVSADQDIATLRGNVRMADTARVANAEHGIYTRSTRTLRLMENVRGTGPEGAFESTELIYDRTRDILTLTGSPRITETGRDVRADRIVRDAKRLTTDAEGNVRILILPDSTRIFGAHSVYDERAGRTLVTGAPRMESPGQKGEASLVVRADTLVLNENTQVGEAIGSVRIVRGEMRTRSDRARFLLNSDQIFLVGNPVAWDRDGEIWADTISVRVREKKAEQLKAFGDVRVHYIPRDKPGEQNIVVGDTLTARLVSGAVTDMEIQGNAVSLYLPDPADAGTGTGRNYAKARKIHVYLSRGQAQRVDLVQSASGIYLYPTESAQRKLANPSFRDSILSLPADSGAVREDSTRSGRPPAGPRGGAAVRPGAAPGETTVPDTTGATAPDLPGTPAIGGEPGRLPARTPARPDSAPPEPRPINPVLQALLRRGSPEVPDSLATPLDKLFTEKVDYQGDTIRFYVPEDRIRILGHGKLSYRGSELASEDINYRADRHLVIATGQPKLSDAQTAVVGQKMTYRTDDREGIVYQGRTEFEGGYYYGEEIKRLPTEDLLVRSGDYTTCAAEGPDSVSDYHFHASRMKVIPKDKVVAQSVVLYIKHIPILGLPFYVFPIKTGRHSGIMMPDFELGFGNRGRFVRNMGYYWAISDYMDARSWIDYYDQGPRIFFNGIYTYRIRYLLEGDLDAGWSRENSSFGGRRVGWSVQGSHRQSLGESARLTASANFVSDKSFRGDRDFGAGVDERLNRILKSTIDLHKTLPWSALSTSLVRTEYLDPTTASGVRVSQQAPSIDFTINNRPIGIAPDASGRGGRLRGLSSTYAGTSFAYRNTYTKNYSGVIVSNQALQQNVSLSDSRKLGPFLRVRPAWSGTWAGFAKNNLGQRNRAGAAWSASVSLGSTLYGLFLLPRGPLQGLRHIIEPSMSYSYSPELRQLTLRDSLGKPVGARFPNVGGIGLSGAKSSAMNFSLNQRFHVKWKRAGVVQKKENLLTWSTGTRYDFLKAHHAFSSISNTLSLRPFSTFESSASIVHDPVTRAPGSFSVNTNMRISSLMFQKSARADTSLQGSTLQYGNLGEAGLQGADRGNRRTGQLSAAAPAGPLPWDLSLNHSYSTSRGGGKQNTLNGTVSLSPTQKWQFSGSLYLDLVRRKAISHSLMLHRDLHCWEFRFEYRSSGGNSEYFFRIDIKQLPDVQYQRQGG